MTDSFTEHAELALASTRAMTKRFWGPVPLWVAGLHLVGREARVLIAITSFAGKQSNIERGPDGVIILTRAARVALGTIADHTNLARRHVQTAIRGLEAKGILRRCAARVTRPNTRSYSSAEPMVQTAPTGAPDMVLLPMKTAPMGAPFSGRMGHRFQA
jgi:DNA-binding MarR family transcriptional regulator